MPPYIVSFVTGLGVTNPFPIVMAGFCVYFVGVCTGFFLPDLLGRRKLFIATSTACAVGMLLVACLTTAFPTPSETVQKVSIAFVFVWFIAAGTQAPLVWIITAESAPTRNRERVLGMATFSGFGVSIIIQFVAPYIQDAGFGNLGSKIGFLWGAFSVITVVFAYYMLPEYKGFSLEQLDFLFDQRTPARKFAGYHFTDDLLASTETNPTAELMQVMSAEKEIDAKVEYKV